MEITSFNPMIVSAQADNVVELFEGLGFEKTHEIGGIDGKDITNFRMTDSTGFHVDVAQVDSMERDMMIIRMNVDDFDEAYQLLLERGFRNSRGDGTVDTASNKSALMISPTGFAFDLCQHIK